MSIEIALALEINRRAMQITLTIGLGHLAADRRRVQKARITRIEVTTAHQNLMIPRLRVIIPWIRVDHESN